MRSLTVALILTASFALHARSAGAQLVSCTSAGAPCTESFIVGLGGLQRTAAHGATSLTGSNSQVVSDFNRNSVASTGFAVSLESDWIDTFLVTGGTGPGVMTVNWSLDGTLNIPAASSSCPVGNPSCIVRVTFQRLTGFGSQSAVADLPIAATSQAKTVHLTGSFDVPFTYGAVFTGGFRSVGSTGESGGFFDFLNGGHITGLILPAGATLQTGSGASYPVTVLTATQAEGSAAPVDFDGDGKADIAVFRPSNGTWFIEYSRTGTVAGIQWGNGLDVPVPGDYDGDGKTDITVFRPSNGTWFIQYSGTGTVTGIQWGNGNDRPVPGDYDGDGKTDIAVFRPSNGTWFIVYSRTGTAAGVQWGNGNDRAVPGDYDGDGKTDIAVFRPSNGTWFIVNSSTGTAAGIQWGNGVDRPVPGDYDGDGKTDIAVFRPSSGTWFLQYSGTGTVAGIQWGNGNDAAVPGDYDGDGKTDIAVFRPSNGTWFIQYSSTGTAAGIQWGNGSDIPMPKR